MDYEKLTQKIRELEIGGRQNEFVLAANREVFGDDWLCFQQGGRIPVDARRQPCPDRAPAAEDATAKVARLEAALRDYLKRDFAFQVALTSDGSACIVDFRTFDLDRRIDLFIAAKKLKSEDRKYRVL